MVVLGLILMALAAVAVVGALFTVDGSTQLFGIDLSAAALFFVGLGAGLALMWGAGLARWGARRSLRRRREGRQLRELQEKLDRREAEERRDGQDRGERTL